MHDPDEANRLLWRMLKSFAAKALKVVAEQSKKIGFKQFDKFRENIKTRDVKDLKTLVKRNPGSDIKISDPITQEQAKYVAKRLKNLNQDFLLEKTEDGNFKVITASKNKVLVEDLIEKSKTPQKQGRTFEEVKAKAIAKKEQKQQAKAKDLSRDHRAKVIKHKEVGAR